MKILISVVVVLVGWLSVNNVIAQDILTLGETESVTLLFTNDFESTYDPVLAFWRDDMDLIGGVAQMATLIDQIRPNVQILGVLSLRGATRLKSVRRWPHH